jgi:hypothetical protein
MEAGFVPDANYGGYTRGQWAEGEPRKSFWTGLKVDQYNLIPITTYRCPNCGYLESYAMPEAASEK